MELGSWQSGTGGDDYWGGNLYCLRQPLTLSIANHFPSLVLNLGPMVSMGLTFCEGMDYKEIQPVHPKGNQSWILIGRTDAEAETPIFWPPHVKNWLTGKDPDAGKDWRQEEKGMTEDKMVGWHHQLNGQEFE